MFIEWIPALMTLAILAAVIIWDHKTAKKQEKARKAREVSEDGWFWL